MTSQEQLLDLLAWWEEGRQQGRTPTPEELCPDDQTLREELRKRIAATFKARGIELPVPRMHVTVENGKVLANPRQTP